MPSQKITEAINLIKLSQKTTEIFVPSLNRTIKFKHLTAGQQERFVQAVMDNPAIPTRYNLTLIDVIKENCEDKSVINVLTVVDKYAIGLGLRVASISNMLKTEIANEPGVVYTIDLQENIKRITESVKHDPFDPIIIDDFNIELQYPTINQEASNERFFKREDYSLDNTAEGIRHIISNAFIGDVIMFIKTLTINKIDGTPVVIDFNQITIQDKLDIVRKLPNTVFEKMLDPMSVVKNKIEEILKGTGVSTVDSNIKRSIFITFDAALFIASS